MTFWCKYSQGKLNSKCGKEHHQNIIRMHVGGFAIPSVRCHAGKREDSTCHQVLPKSHQLVLVKREALKYLDKITGGRMLSVHHQGAPQRAPQQAINTKKHPCTSVHCESAKKDPFFFQTLSLLVFTATGWSPMEVLCPPACRGISEGREPVWGKEVGYSKCLGGGRSGSESGGALLDAVGCHV